MAWFRIAKNVKTVFNKVHGEQKDFQLSNAEKYMKETSPKFIFSYLEENIDNGNEIGFYFTALSEHI